MDSSPNGLLLIDKAAGWTSHDAVARTRRVYGTRKVGHAGTLDPMATGLLILGLGASTRLLTFVVGAEKEYVATIRLGSSTTTDDAEGEVLGHAPVGQLERITEEDWRQGILSLTGEIEQVPSTVSAIKVGGKRAYALARAGETVELKPRPVVVSAFEVMHAERGIDAEGHGFIDLLVRVECSSGTYIRALARDLGYRLGVGGHLTTLRRTRIGPFHATDAHPIDSLDAPLALLTPAQAARLLFDVANLAQHDALDLRHGKRITLPSMPDHPGPLAAIDPDDRLIGLISVTSETSRIIVNFPVDESTPHD
jgi:tRNA pseudouridine55 synthase